VSENFFRPEELSGQKQFGKYCGTRTSIFSCKKENRELHAIDVTLCDIGIGESKLKY
jgi:hypothetical protein